MAGAVEEGAATVEVVMAAVEGTAAETAATGPVAVVVAAARSSKSWDKDGEGRQTHNDIANVLHVCVTDIAERSPEQTEQGEEARKRTTSWTIA